MGDGLESVKTVRMKFSRTFVSNVFRTSILRMFTQMNNDGFGQVGAGQDDMRQGGSDLQHYTQTVSPMKQVLDTELKRHKESRNMRLSHLKDHYSR